MTTATTPQPTQDRDDAQSALRVAFWLAVGLVALRLPLLPAALENHDAVNFALGLESYDLALARPHFPGYPVFIALASLAAALGLAAPMALALPGVLACGAAAAALFMALRQRCGAVVAVALALTYGLAPGVLVTDLKALSDGLGLHLFTLCLCGALMAVRRPALRLWVAAGLGVLLGVRASYLALAAPLALWVLVETPTARGRWRVAAAGLAGVAVWLVPLVVTTGGIEELAAIGSAFLNGHFDAWGAGWAQAPSLGARTTAFGWNLAVFALGWPLVAAGVALLVLGRPRLERRAGWLAASVAAPYALWVLFGQHPDSARHALPFVALLLVALAPVAGPARGRRRWAVLALPAVVLLSAAPRLVAHATELPAPVQAAQWLARQHDPAQLQVYSGAETGMYRYYAPAFRTTFVRSPHDVARDLASRGNRPEVVLVTSRAPLALELRWRLTPVAHFERSALVGPRDASLTLYALAASAPADRASQETP